MRGTPMLDPGERSDGTGITCPKEEDDDEADGAPVPATATTLVPPLPLPLCTEEAMSDGITPPMNESLPIATASGRDAADEERARFEPLELELAADAAGAA